LLSILLSILWTPAAQPAVPPLPGPAVPVYTLEVSRLRRTDAHRQAEVTPSGPPSDEAERLYTVRFRYRGTGPAQGLVLVVPLPADARYVPGSATGPGAVISFSVDGGASFDLPDALVARNAAGDERRATPAEYTHIRWELAGEFPPGLSGIVSFRARRVAAGFAAPGAL
jgi:hypothetical protein